MTDNDIIERFKQLYPTMYISALIDRMIYLAGLSIRGVSLSEDQEHEYMVIYEWVIRKVSEGILAEGELV